MWETAMLVQASVIHIRLSTVSRETKKSRALSRWINMNIYNLNSIKSVIIPKNIHVENISFIYQKTFWQQNLCTLDIFLDYLLTHSSICSCQSLTRGRNTMSRWKIQHLKLSIFNYSTLFSQIRDKKQTKTCTFTEILTPVARTFCAYHKAWSVGM